ncbi:hypothetical protein [Achromobacter aegrifaciens]|uniref:hypothetical protein n=1 Tax=Achromobacter aegrifaciens TaxID=1287736 RepID=UPI00320A2744
MLDRILTALMLCGLAGGAMAAPPKVPVFHSLSSQNDQVAERVSFELKEGIRRSAAMSLTTDPKTALIKVFVVALPDAATMTTKYAITWVLNPPGNTSLDRFLTTSVATCGSAYVKDCAGQLVAETDKQASNWAFLLNK